MTIQPHVHLQYPVLISCIYGYSWSLHCCYNTLDKRLPDGRPSTCCRMGLGLAFVVGFFSTTLVVGFLLVLLAIELKDGWTMVPVEKARRVLGVQCGWGQDSEVKFLHTKTGKLCLNVLQFVHKGIVMLEQVCPRERKSSVCYSIQTHSRQSCSSNFGEYRSKYRSDGQVSTFALWEVERNKNIRKHAKPVLHTHRLCFFDTVIYNAALKTSQSWPAWTNIQISLFIDPLRAFLWADGEMVKNYF